MGDEHAEVNFLNILLPYHHNLGVKAVKLESGNTSIMIEI